MYSGSISCDYTYDKYYENEDYSTLHLIDIHGENYENYYNISNKKDYPIKINFEAIYNSHFSI